MLTEVLLALTLAAVLVLTAASWPGLFRRTADPVQAALDLTATAAVIESVLRRELQLAGYLGCASGLAGRPASLAPAVGIYSADTAAQAPTWVQSALDRAAANSQVLLVQYVQPQSRTAPDGIRPLPDGALELVLDRPADDWKRGDELLLTDCERLAFVDIDRVLQKGGLLLLHPHSAADGSKLTQFKSPVRAALPVRRLFYLGGSGPDYSLYRRDRGRSATALVEGLSSWQLQLQPALPPGIFPTVGVSVALRSPAALAPIGRPLQRSTELRFAAYNLR